MTVTFTVPGAPQTKGSSKAFRSASTGKIIVRNDNAKCSGWSTTIAWYARQAMAGRPPLHGPVRVEAAFTLARPATVKRKARPGYLGPLLDGDKLTRACWDALTGIVYVDDSQVVEWSGSKAWGEPGVRIVVSEERP